MSQTLSMHASESPREDALRRSGSWTQSALDEARALDTAEAAPLRAARLKELRAVNDAAHQRREDAKAKRRRESAERRALKLKQAKSCQLGYPGCTTVPELVTTLEARDLRRGDAPLHALAAACSPCALAHQRW